jgi:RNA polymerase sigma-70 factor (ECF subfamily)
MSNTALPPDEMQLARAGLRQLFLDHYPETVVYARRLTAGDQALAEDLVMDACLATWLRVSNCAENLEIRNLSAYLRRSVRNLYIDHLRRHHREVLSARPEEQDDSSSWRPVEEMLEAAALRHLIDNLPAPYPAVLWAKASGATNHEIAEQLGLSSRGHAAVVVHRARAALRAILHRPA